MILTEVKLPLCTMYAAPPWILGDNVHGLMTDPKRPLGFCAPVSDAPSTTAFLFSFSFFPP